MEREGVKFIHLKPILLKLISGLNGLDRLMTSNLKTGRKAFKFKLFFVFSSKQKQKLLGFQTFTCSVQKHFTETFHSFFFKC